MTESAQVMMEEREELDDLHRSKTSCGCCVLNISVESQVPRSQECIPMRVKLNQFYWQRSGGEWETEEGGIDIAQEIPHVPSPGNFIGDDVKGQDEEHEICL